MFKKYRHTFHLSTIRYAPLSGAESGDGSPDDSSVTPLPRDSMEKAFCDERTPIRRSWRYFACFYILAVGLLVGGALGMLGLTYTKHPRGAELTPSGAGIKQFAPKVPRTTVIFSEKTALMDPPSDANQRDWDALMPIGRGFVNVSHPEAFGLLPGITTLSGVDRYSVAMFHQLHCLRALRDDYWRLIDGMSATWTDQARQEEVRKQLRGRHAQHCFAYLAESIMCAGDLTIEWAKVERDGSRTQVDGWGVPHECKNPEAIRAWMEANHGPTSVHMHHQ